ncbi:TonB-dependent receptor domain-containing protein [Asticcacaulis sp. W401b]|uniref:TonB-dependent receptor domain-containing protein n=1 Tax=Asticcacaulis sp. W401b TaxID=3388666 RepID=UPI003970F1BF
MNKRMTRALIMSSVAASAIFSGWMAAPAMAQADGASEAVEEVVVTGTRIRRPNLKSASPITTVDAQEAQLQGAVAVESFLTKLPQVEAAANENGSNGSSGRATVNLRSLGGGRSLVLIDGQRFLPTQAMDLNFVPSALVERTDVLTGGASSVYGSDAMSGVVNFILMKHLDGVRMNAQYSIYNHHNDEGYLRKIQSDKKYKLAPENVWTGKKFDFNIAMGANLEDGKGNVAGYFGYRKMDPVRQDKYDYSNCAINYPPASVAPAGTAYVCGGSATHAYGSFRPLTYTPAGGTSTNTNPTGVQYANAMDGSKTWVTDGPDFYYNYTPDNYILRDSERYTAGALFNYSVNEKIEAYGSFMFMDDVSVSQVAPSGIWTGRAFTVNCDNPFLSTQQRGLLCNGNTTGNATTWVALRGVGGEGRRNDMRHTYYRANLGFRGTLSDAFRYDVNYSYVTARERSNYQNDINQNKAAQALQAVTVGGQIVCKDTSGSCKPIDVFSAKGPSTEGYNFIYSPTFTANDQDMKVLSGYISGDLGIYGVTSPWASEGLQVVLGAEHREETTVTKFDQVQIDAGSVNSDGVITTDEIFTEIEAPIVQDKPFIYSLSLALGYRTSTIKVSNSANPEREKDADTYKYELKYQPVPDVLLRASYNKAMRAPNAGELFAAQSYGNIAATDPCSQNGIAQSGATLEQCLRTGATTAQYNAKTIPDCPATFCTRQGGGNPNLNPETGKTTTYGVVFTPRFVPGLSVSLDYFKVRIEDYIGTISPTVALSQCVQTGNPVFCGLIHRDPLTGAIFGPGADGGYIVGTNVNTGYLETKGWDVNAAYTLQTEDVFQKDYGSVNFNLTGTLLKSLETEAIPNGGSYDCKGLFGPVCGQPAPEWRHTLRTTWQTTWGDKFYLPAAVSVNWRYMGVVKLASNTGKPFLTGTKSTIDAKIPEYSYVDVAATFNVTKGVVARVGINNLFDKTPPYMYDALLTEFGNGNTYPGVYDPLGRMVFVGFNAKF